MGGGLVEIHKFEKTEHTNSDVLPFFEYVDFEKEEVCEIRHLEILHPLLEELFPNHVTANDEYNYYVLTEEKLDVLISRINSQLIDQSKEMSEYFYERYSKKINTLLEALEEQATDFDFDGDKVLTISWGQ